jgi:uncharacterized membrane-anchored protein
MRFLAFFLNLLLVSGTDSLCTTFIALIDIKAQHKGIIHIFLLITGKGLRYSIVYQQWWSEE